MVRETVITHTEALLAMLLGLPMSYQDDLAQSLIRASVVPAQMIGITVWDKHRFPFTISREATEKFRGGQPEIRAIIKDLVNNSEKMVAITDVDLDAQRPNDPPWITIEVRFFGREVETPSSVIHLCANRDRVEICHIE